jgi:hypothetical protein
MNVVIFPPIFMMIIEFNFTVMVVVVRAFRRV